MHSSQNQNRHRARPVKGAQPPFSQHLVRKIIATIILVALIIAPVFQFPPRRVQGANPTYSVAIIDYAFQPLHINITTGATVVWTYASNWRDFHTVTSDPGTNKTQAGTALLNSGSIYPGQSFSHTFNQPGYYPYQCSVHPTIANMNGWVNVTGAPVTPPPSQTSAPNYSLITAAVGVATATSIATLVFFIKKKRRNPIAPTSVQGAMP